jgi:hypothetical protein
MLKLLNRKWYAWQALENDFITIEIGKIIAPRLLQLVIHKVSIKKA